MYVALLKGAILSFLPSVRIICLHAEPCVSYDQDVRPSVCLTVTCWQCHSKQRGLWSRNLAKFKRLNLLDNFEVKSFDLKVVQNRSIAVSLYRKATFFVIRLCTLICNIINSVRSKYPPSARSYALNSARHAL